MPKIPSKGRAALEQLLETLKKEQPERLNKAQDAGYKEIWTTGAPRGDITAFDPDIPATWFTKEPTLADRYANKYGPDAYVDFDVAPTQYPALVKYENPASGKDYLRLVDQNNYDKRKAIELLKQQGFDSVLYDDGEVLALFDPSNAKSVFNDFTDEALESPKFASGGAVRKAFDHLILKGADLPSEGLEVLKNASSKEARDFAKGTREQNIRTALDPEGNSYVWDAYYGTHKPVAEALGHQLGELEPNEADWLTDVFALDKGKMLSLQDVQPHIDGTDRLEFGLSQKERDALHKARWKQFYPYSVLFGAPAFADDEQQYAAGGVVQNYAKGKLVKPLLKRLYHGSEHEISEFLPNTYFSPNEDFAARFGKNVVPVDVDVTDFHRIDDLDKFFEENADDAAKYFGLSPEDITEEHIEKFASEKFKDLPGWYVEDAYNYGPSESLFLKHPKFTQYVVHDPKRIKKIKKYAAGGKVVKKGLKEALEHLNSYKGQGHHNINTEKGRPIQELMMRELGEDSDYPMQVLRFNYGAFDDAGNIINPTELKVGDILSSKNLTSTYGDYDDDMLEQLASSHVLNDIEPHAFQIKVEPSAKYIDVEQQLKKLYGNKFSDHENEIILSPGTRYMLEDAPELRKAPDGSEYYNYWLKHLPESDREEFPELFSKPIKGYIASALGAAGLADQRQDPQGYASGGAVRAGAESALHGLTLGLDETIPALVAGHYAKIARPDLFEDFTGDELVGIVKANLEAERHKREEEHPIADITGLLVSGLMPMGLAKTLLGQMGTGAAMTALQSLNDGDSAEDIGINSAFGAAIPPALRYWKVTAPAGAAGALYGLKQAYADE